MSPAKAHSLSAQLAKFSEDTLSSYTEAVSAQVLTRDDSAPGLFRKPRTLLFCDLLSSTPVSRGHCFAALPRQPPPHSNILVPPGPFSLLASEAISRETRLGPRWPHGLSLLPPGNATLHLGPLSAGDPGDIAYAEPQLQPVAQPGLCHGEGGPSKRPLPQQAFCPSASGCRLPLKRPLAGQGMPSPFPNPRFSLQVLCCVDKQGILSWPNPSPETVLFFSGKVEPPHSSHEDLTDDLSTRSFCHPEVEEEVRPAPGGPAGSLREGGARREKGSGTIRMRF